jgi:hypothetical protein
VVFQVVLVTTRNKIDHHNITEILLKVAFNTNNIILILEHESYHEDIGDVPHATTLFEPILSFFLNLLKRFLFSCKSDYSIISLEFSHSHPSDK